MKETRSKGGRSPLPGAWSRRVVAEPPAPASTPVAGGSLASRAGPGLRATCTRDQWRGRSRCVAVGEKERKGRRERLRERQRGRERRAGDGGVRASRGRNGGGWGRDEADYVDLKSEGAVYIHWAGSGVEAGGRHQGAAESDSSEIRSEQSQPHDPGSDGCRNFGRRGQGSWPRSMSGLCS